MIKLQQVALRGFLRNAKKEQLQEMLGLIQQKFEEIGAQLEGGTPIEVTAEDAANTYSVRPIFDAIRILLPLKHPVLRVNGRIQDKLLVILRDFAATIIKMLLEMDVATASPPAPPAADESVVSEIQEILTEETQPVEETAAEQPAAEETVAEDTVLEESIVEEPAVEEPADNASDQAAEAVDSEGETEQS